MTKASRVTDTLQRDARETEANVFACALLMPHEMLAEDLDKIEWHFDIANDDWAHKMAKRYKVPVVTFVWWMSFSIAKGWLRKPRSCE